MSYFDKLFGLQGRTALCTGSTRGIGRGMARALANAGADILLVQVSLLVPPSCLLYADYCLVARETTAIHLPAMKSASSAGDARL